MTSAWLPIAGVELAALIWAVGLVLLARRTYASLRLSGQKIPEIT